MTVKRFFGDSARDALRKVKAALGPEAIVVSNKSVPGGVEIMAMSADSLEALSRQGGPSAAPVPAQAKPAAPATLHLPRLHRLKNRCVPSRRRRLFTREKMRATMRFRCRPRHAPRCLSSPGNRGSRHGRKLPPPHLLPSLPHKWPVSASSRAPCRRKWRPSQAISKWRPRSVRWRARSASPA